MQKDFCGRYAQFRDKMYEGHGGMGTLFVSDLDGTLLTKDEVVSAYSVERLNKLLDAGILFTYATARSAISAKRATAGLRLRAPAILYNGGLVYDFNTHETLSSVLFAEEEKGYIRAVLHEYGILPVVFGATKTRERLVWLEGRETEGIRRYLHRRAGDDRLGPVRSEEALTDGYVFYFKCIGPYDLLARAWNDLKLDTRFVCIFHPETYAEDFWMEIYPRAATKANGVRFLRGWSSSERAVCFGDTSNDSDMFDVCEEKYAVMNADAWLKEKATGVIGYCEEDGVVKFLEEYCARRGMLS